MNTNNCATCRYGSVNIAKIAEVPCGDCLTEEMTTKTPYTKWEARQ